MIIKNTVLMPIVHGRRCVSYVQMSIATLPSSDGQEADRWHAKQLANYQEILRRKMRERKGKERYERVPEMLKRLVRTA